MPTHQVNASKCQLDESCLGLVCGSLWMSYWMGSRRVAGAQSELNPCKVLLLVVCVAVGCIACERRCICLFVRRGRELPTGRVVGYYIESVSILRKFMIPSIGAKMWSQH